jgi:hypothetical protein
MSKSNFIGLLPLFVSINKDIYSSFAIFPSYIGKSIVGFFYGLIFGFLYTFWKKELFYTGAIVASTLFLLTYCICITIHWETIYELFGVESFDISVEMIMTFWNTYFFEIGVALFVFIIFNQTFKKYQV